MATRAAGNAQSLREVERAAVTFGVKIQYFDVLIPKDIETAFRAADKARADAVLILVPGTVFLTHRAQIRELAGHKAFRVMYSGREYVEDGGLITYSVSYDDLFRRAATFVHKILKGAKPRADARGDAG